MVGTGFGAGLAAWTFGVAGFVVAGATGLAVATGVEFTTVRGRVAAGEGITWKSGAGGGGDPGTGEGVAGMVGAGAVVAAAVIAISVISTGG